MVAEVGGRVTLSAFGATTINLTMNALTLPELGLYFFNLYLNDEVAKSVSFSVSERPQKSKS